METIKRTKIVDVLKSEAFGTTCLLYTSDAADE